MRLFGFGKAEAKAKAIETPITIGSRTQDKVSCANCGRTGVVSDFFTYQGKDGNDVYLCPDCRSKVNLALEDEQKQIKTWKVVLVGIVAAIAGAIAWYYFTVAAEAEYGVVAIGLGYLVGYGALFGAGMRRSRKVQIVSVILAGLSIFIAEYFIFSHVLNEYMVANPTSFEGWDGQKLWIDPWSPVFLQSIISPIGLIIWAVALYVAFIVPKPKKI